MAGRWKWKSNRLYFFIAAYTLVLGLLASLGYLEVTRFEEAQEKKAKAAAHEDVSSDTSAKSLYRLPRMELTLSSFEGDTHHARIGISLEIDKTNMERFMDFQPRVSDQIIGFLRQQDISEIRKPNFMFRFRRDLLRIVNQASGPVPVTDVIFREFVVR